MRCSPMPTRGRSTIRPDTQARAVLPSTPTRAVLTNRMSLTSFEDSAKGLAKKAVLRTS
jgi:hypothetical protein